MDHQIIIFSKNGSQILQKSNKDNTDIDDEASFRGILSILEPLTRDCSGLLYSIVIANNHIDVYFDGYYFFFSIISCRSRKALLSINSIFVVEVSRIFRSFTNQKRITKEMPLEEQVSFFSLISHDTLELILVELNPLLIPSVSYLTFISMDNRVIYSLGASKEAPDQFVLSWFAALEASDSLGDNSYIQANEFPHVFVFHFLPPIKLVVYFGLSFNPNEYFDHVNSVIQNISSLFEEKPLFKPKMPSYPSRGRRHIHRTED